MKSLPVLNIRQFYPDEKHEEFYANDFADHLKNHHRAILTPHKHNVYLAVLFTSGTGIHEIDFNAYEVKRGSVFFMNPGQTHHWEFSDDVNGYIFFHSEGFYNLHFSDSTVQGFPFYYSTQNPPCIYLKEDELIHAEMTFANILEEYRTENLYKHHKICSLVDMAYIDLARIYVNADYKAVVRTSNYSNKLKMLETLIEKHFHTEKSPGKYAGWMNMTTKHLNRITKESVDKTTSDMIIDRVVLEAKRMLIHSKDNFSTVAEALGYEDYAYFSRLFKKRTGETPSEFAKRYVLTSGGHL